MVVRAFVLSACILFGPMVLMIAGCANTTNVAKLGKDTYTMSAYRSQARGGTAAARGVVLIGARRSGYISNRNELHGYRRGLEGVGVGRSESRYSLTPNSDL